MKINGIYVSDIDFEIVIDKEDKKVVSVSNLNLSIGSGSQHIFFEYGDIDKIISALQSAKKILEIGNGTN